MAYKVKGVSYPSKAWYDKNINPATGKSYAEETRKAQVAGKAPTLTSGWQPHVRFSTGIVEGPIFATQAEANAWTAKQVEGKSPPYLQSSGTKEVGKPVAEKEPKAEPKVKPEIEPEKEPEPEVEPEENGDDLEIPQGLEDDPFFAQLDPQSQAMIAYYQNILDTQDTARQDAFEKALELAGEDAEPFWKEKLSIIKDELSRAIGTLGADLASREKELTRRSKEIEEDLIYNKENLTVDESAELARTKRAYDQELEVIGDTMANRGLTSSTIRNRAESRLEESYVDVIESTGRKYARAQRAEGVGATRLQADITQQVADLQRGFAEAKTGAARGTEAYVGSEALGKLGLGLEGLGLGGIKGGMAEEKATDVLQRSQALMLQNYPQFT